MEAATQKPYLAHLTRAGELLRAEKLEEARDALEQAIGLKPGDGRIMNLLGLTYFRLGRYPEAQAIYGDLVRRQPQDASLRLNLGLVHLKRGDVDDAIRELNRARELDPSHVRTMGYLGLAFARKGRYALARDAFHAAGQDDLAKEMDAQLATELSQMGRLPTAPPPPPQAPTPPHTPAEGVPVNPPVNVPISVPVQITRPATVPPPLPPPLPPPAPPAATRPPATVPPGEIPTRPGPGPVTLELEAVTPQAPLAVERGAAPERLDVFTRRRVVRPEARELPLEVAADLLIIRVRGRILTRNVGVVATGGMIGYAPATRRVRGRVTPDPFAGDGAMSFATGDGHLVAVPRDHIFATLQLVDQALYLREPVVFAFEERLSWENGHVPGSSGAIPILQLRGEGSVALRTRRPIIAVEVRASRMLVVDAAALAGWSGSLVPRLTGSTVELNGDGSVFIEEPR